MLCAMCDLKMYDKIPVNRYKKTLKMLNEICPSPNVIFDLGVRNPFSEIMEKKNYKVYNTSGQDFDLDPNVDIPGDVDLVTGFENDFLIKLINYFNNSIF